MSYVTWQYFALVLAVLVLYYIVPLKIRWTVLLAGSLGFYGLFMGRRLQLVLFLGTILLSYLFGLGIEQVQGEKKRRALLFFATVICTGPLLAIKAAYFWPGALHFAGFERERLLSGLVAPLGISFYTLQILAYLIDIFRGRIRAQRNLLRYTLFLSFFPQILQGPIPRYEQLSKQLFEGRRFCFDHLVRGAQLVLWGFFLKFMIADKAALYVDQVFDNETMYAGAYVLLAGVLYSLQLYADFLGCVTISMGVAQMFGIHLTENFDHPYLAVSISEFWRRWHISLSSWLRDYIYIPLGGNRKGTLRRYINLTLTFLVSGFWHGEGLRFLVWGLMHAVYQIAGKTTAGLRAGMYRLLRIPEGSFAWTLYHRVWTFFWVMLGWIMFRAKSVKAGFLMIRNALTVWNPWVLLNGSLEQTGLDRAQWEILFLSAAVLIFVSVMQQRICIRDWISRQHISIRFLLYIAAVLTILVFGTYGYGYNARDFIYGGF